MDKQLFDDAIGEVPPSTVDVDAAITRGRRAARLRRVANPAVAAGVAVVLLTGVVAYTMTGDQDVGAPVGSPVVTSTTAPTTVPTTAPPTTMPEESATVPATEMPPPSVSLADNAVPPKQCDTDDLESPGEVIGRLSTAATDAVHRQRADLQLVPNAEGEYPRGTPHGPLEFYQVNNQQAGAPLPVCDANGYFMAVATVKAPAGDGNMLVTISPAYVIEGKSMTCAAPMAELKYCEPVTGPKGEVILTTTYQFSNGTIMNRVEIVRKDGNELMVQAENTPTSSKSNGGPTTDTPPLTHDQLIAIGTDPALTVFPR